MKIKVGEYIRTKDGIIAKIVSLDEHCRHYGERLEDTIYIVDNEKLKYRLNAEDIKSHSFNITEILEEDDYVNGMRVSYIRFPNDPYEPAEIYVLDKHINFIFASDIKSVVTHEQFKAMEYEVK